MNEIDAPGLAAVRNRVGHFTLGADALDAPDDLRQLLRRLDEWESDARVLAIVLRASGTDSTPRPAREARAVALRTAGYSKPLLALLDGRLHGATLRLLQGATLRSVSERTTLLLDDAAPGICEADDTPLLARLPPALRNYLQLTGCALRPADALYTGLADFCLPSEMVAEFDRCLDEMSWNNHPREALRTLLATVATRKMPGAELKALRLAIDEHFAFDDLAAIRASLAGEMRPAYQDWAEETLALLERRHPASPGTAANRRHRASPRAAGVATGRC